MLLKILDLIKYYKLVQEDCDLLSGAARRNRTTDIEELLRHNRQYRVQLISLVRNSFPATATDVADWTDSEWYGWLDFLVEYPVFWTGKEEILIGLFWSLDGKGLLKDVKDVVLLCTHREMVDFAADYRNKTAVNTLNALIDKYASQLQAETFQNRVDLRINEFH